MDREPDIKKQFIKAAQQNGIPLSLFAHRHLDKGWNMDRASKESPSDQEKYENKNFNSRLMI